MENSNKVYVDFINAKKGYKPDRKYFKTYEDAHKFVLKTFDRYDADAINYTEFETPLKQTL